MPISSSDLQELAKVSLDEYLRNMPVDQIATERPLLKKLMQKRKLFLGAKQNIVESVRKDYGSNFAWTYGEAPVAFNKRHTTENVSFPWRRAVDGLYLDYDRLFAAGIKVREGERGQYKLEHNERVQLINLLDEQLLALREGFLGKLDMELHRSGASSADAVTGLDALVSVTPTSGTVGGIASSNAWWRNYAKVSVSAASLAEEMERAWRACITNGGTPDFIMCGSDFVDAYRKAVTVTNNANAGDVKRLDAGVGTGVSTGLYFKGVELVWDPQMDALQRVESAAQSWLKRCYFLNSRHLTLRDDGMDIVTPVRPHNTLAMYAMVNLRLALTTNRRNAHAVLALA